MTTLKYPINGGENNQGLEMLSYNNTRKVGTIGGVGKNFWFEAVVLEKMKPMQCTLPFSRVGQTIDNLVGTIKNSCSL